jgi:UDP-3-O-[3-hydroxymyristoyl] N-acetylglucosamine deacetylase/3-hydroxyacyl-[acyl-carrier-protein] dehydratase
MSDLQRTIAQSGSIRGTALHTGAEVAVTLRPAPPGTGFVFRRVDLKDAPEVVASVEHVTQVERATTIMQGSVKVRTVEHVLSALRGLGVDNAVIELDAPEPPILDGSAKAYTALVRDCGIVEQDQPREYFEPRQPIYVEGPEGASVIVLPARDLTVSLTSVTHTGFHTQFHRYKWDPSTYEKEIAPARTFVFYEEIQPLLDKGLIKGGSVDSAVVIHGNDIIAKEPLRFQNEFARHKILDVIGDLALFPRRLRGHVIAVRTGHSLNCDLARALLKAWKQYDAQRQPVASVPAGEGAMDINEVMKVLPHRYPFLLIDRVLKFDGKRAWACKSVTINEPFFQGHFPGHPVMPGVLQVEAMAQLGSILLLREIGKPGSIGYFMSADSVKFRKPVLPGDQLIIECELLKARGRIGKARGQCLVNGEVVSEGELTFALAEA